LTVDNIPNLEVDLQNNFYIRDRLHDDRKYAVMLYRALINMRWQKQDVMSILSNTYWSCSWRTAGRIVADLRDRDENYLDYYCSDFEGYVDPEIEYDLQKIDWKPVPWPEIDSF